jgi:hypothetical protein
MFRKNSYIKGIVAGLMLVLFAFSVTPKNILHALFADHKDEVYLSKGSNSPQVKTFDYLCKIDTTVVESPFIESSTHFEFAAFQPQVQYLIITSYFFNSTPHFFFEHRGPPAIA